MVEADLLRSLPIFAGVDPRTLQMLIRRSTERRFGVDEVLFLAGATPTALLLVAAGRVRVVRAHRGRQVLVHEEGPGGALGEVPLFAGGSYPATAIAMEPTRCIQISLEAIQAAVSAQPDLAFVFLKRLAVRLRGVVDQLDRLAVQSVETRLARYLLARETEMGNARPFTLGRTQTIAAEELGTVREVLVRSLRRLREERIIQATGRGYYRVLDHGRLRQLAAP